MSASIRTSVASTSSVGSARTSRRATVVVQAADKLARNIVGVRREVESSGKTFDVTFLARGGAAKTVKCADNQYILDAAEAAGVDLPATCRAGICGACVARVASGTIDQSDIPDLEFTLNEKEQAAGMALLCMSRATSDLKIETQSDWGYSLGVGEWKGASGLFSAEPDPLMGTEWSKMTKEQQEAAAKAGAAKK